jgi:hypothetical protein
VSSMTPFTVRNLTRANSSELESTSDVSRVS